MYTRLPIISLENIALVENDTTISEENEIAEIFGLILKLL